MSEYNIDNDWVDRYIRDELSAEEEIAFEERLLDDPELQQQLQAALAIRESFSRTDLMTDDEVNTSFSTTRGNSWTPLAMAASVILAVVSSTLLWRANIESAELRQQINELHQPRTRVLNVPIDIMRSSGKSTPDAIIQKPDGQAAIVLDIELSGRFQKADEIHFELREESASEVLLAWSAQPPTDNRATVILNSESLPDGRVILSISATGIQPESRLLEFRSENRD